MSEENAFDLMEEADVDDGEEEEIIECFGEYGLTPLCKDCVHAIDCKKLKEAERTLAKRYKGKYTGRGKAVDKDKY